MQTDTSLTLVVTIDVLPERDATFLAIFAERHAAATTGEPLTLAYDLHRDRDHPHRYVVVERFASEAGLAAHLAASTSHVALMACFAAPPTVVRLAPVAGCCRGPSEPLP